MRRDLITTVQESWSEAVVKNKLTTAEGIHAAMQWLALVIMSVADTEKQAHEVLNKANEANHEYVNDNWLGAQEAKRRHAQEVGS